MNGFTNIKNFSFNIILGDDKAVVYACESENLNKIETMLLNPYLRKKEAMPLRE